jgi:hypothetical protein
VSRRVAQRRNGERLHARRARSDELNAPGAYDVRYS